MENMTWKAQLKVTGKTFTKPKIKLEPEDNTNCKEALKKIFEFWDNYKTSGWGSRRSLLCIYKTS